MPGLIRALVGSPAPPQRLGIMPDGMARGGLPQELRQALDMAVAASVLGQARIDAAAALAHRGVGHVGRLVAIYPNEFAQIPEVGQLALDLVAITRAQMFKAVTS